MIAVRCVASARTPCRTTGAEFGVGGPQPRLPRPTRGPQSCSCALTTGLAFVPMTGAQESQMRVDRGGEQKFYSEKTMARFHLLCGWLVGLEMSKHATTVCLCTSSPQQRGCTTSITTSLGTAAMDARVHDAGIRARQRAAATLGDAKHAPWSCFASDSRHHLNPTCSAAVPSRVCHAAQPFSFDGGDQIAHDCLATLLTNRAWGLLPCGCLTASRAAVRRAGGEMRGTGTLGPGVC